MAAGICTAASLGETPYLGSRGVQAGAECRALGDIELRHTLSARSLRRQGPGKGLRGGVSAGNRDFTRGRYKGPRGRGAEGHGGTRAKRGPAGSRGTASLEALRASRLLQAPAARANCAQLLPRGGFGARGPATVPRGGRARPEAQTRHPGAATCAPPASHAPPRRAAGPPAGTRAPSAHTLPGTHTNGPAHVRHAPPSPAPRPRPRGAGRRLPIGRPARDARRPAPPLVSHSAEAALVGTSLVRRLAAAASAAAGARAPAAEGGRGGGRGAGPRRLPGRLFSSEQRRFRLWGGRGYSPSMTMGDKKSPTRYLLRAEGAEGEGGLGAGGGRRRLGPGATRGGGRRC